MTTRSQFPQSIFPFGLAARTALGALLAAPWVHAQAQPGFPLLKSCGDTTAVVTTVQSSDPVQIRFSFATDSGTCYAVTATVDGNAVNGYLISGAHWGSETHPAILTFEREMQTHAPVIPAPPPPPPAPPATSPTATKMAPAPAEKEAPPEAPLPLSFAGFRAVDVQGNRVDLSTQRAPNVVVYFWSALNKRGIQKT